MMAIVFCVALVLYLNLTGVADYTARSLSRLFVLSYPSVRQSKVGPYCLSETLSSPVCHCAKIICFHGVLVELAFILTRCKPVSHEEVSLLRDDLERYQCLAPAYQWNATGGNT